MHLYKKYLSVNDKQYLSWALTNMVNWNPEYEIPEIVHIHGKKDSVFPYHQLSGNVISVDKGTHVMIITCCKWLNENLPKIISGEI
ncbi:MAG: hypothetical protein HRT68_12820 [Flavobacteriaceae bacterium]|nr:hypothetical protein [Flavobacteriaceae bacterium]